MFSILINEKEYPCEVEYKYWPAYEGFFDYKQGHGLPPTPADVELTAIVIQVGPMEIDLLSNEYNWILTKDDIEVLEGEVLAYAEKENAPLPYYEDDYPLTY